MFVEVIGASTRTDAHGHSLSIDSLQSTADLINNPDIAFPYLLEHTRALPALGKQTSARLENAAGNHTELIIKLSLFEDVGTVEFKGKLLIIQACKDDSRPIVGIGLDPVHQVTDIRLYLDPEDYPSLTDIQPLAIAIAERIDGISHADVALATRKSFFGLEVLACIVFGKLIDKVIDKKLDKPAQALDEATQLDSMNSAITKIKQGTLASIQEARRRKQPNRPDKIQQMSVIPYENVIVEFHYAEIEEESIEHLYTSEEMGPMFQQAAEMGKKLDAVRVRYKIRDNHWDLLSFDDAEGQQVLPSRSKDELEFQKLEVAELRAKLGLLDQGFSIAINVKDEERIPNKEPQ